MKHYEIRVVLYEVGDPNEVERHGKLPLEVVVDSVVGEFISNDVEPVKRLRSIVHDVAVVRLAEQIRLYDARMVWLINDD